MKLPLIRSLAVAPARAPILRYGVALLSTVLALIPTLFFSDLAESRLVVFAVAVMVSAWYGGWKPGLAATSFALTVSAYYSFAGELTPARVSQGDRAPRAVLCRGVADLLVQRRPPRGPGKSAPVGKQFPLAGDECSLRHLPLRCARNSSGRKSRTGGHVRLFKLRRAYGPASRKSLRRCPAVVSNCRLFSCAQGIQRS